MNASRQTGVVIIGGGFTGLSAARALTEAGVDFVLLEAQDHVGGRVESRLNGLGERVDTGGQFLCDDMPELLALMRSNGRALVETRFDGAPVSLPPMDPQAIEPTYAAAMALRARLKRFGLQDAPVAGLSVAEWLAGQPEPEPAKAAFRSMMEGLWCLALEKVPAWYLASNDRRVTNTAFELQYFVAGTMHGLAGDLAAGLGDRLRLGLAAERIEHDADGVRVTALATAGDTGSGARRHGFRAAAALVCLPPATAARLDFSPVLPPALGKALGAWRSGAVIKLFLRYSCAFWRERGLSGTVLWRDPAGLYAFDASPDDGHATLGFFIGGPIARETTGLGEAGVKARAIGWLTAALGPQAGEPLDVLVRDWTDDRWSGGAYSDLVVDMDATDAEAMLRAGAPPVFFAASELSPSFPGYIEGAIVAGRAGAANILETFQSAIATSASGS